MAKRRKNNPDQPELPIEGVSPGNGENLKSAPAPNGNGNSEKIRKTKRGNGETHVLAENVALPAAPQHVFEPGKIVLPFHRRVDRSFLDYASYVIRDRAIPNLADGLKPVQRRILWAMHESDDGRFTKVANVMGDATKYHPHGEAAIGDALVVLANKRYLIDRQGNYGNIYTGDPAAAPRYIECRLTELARTELFYDELTELVPSYDGRNKEPVTLPCKLPLLLMLGTEGI